MTTRYKPADLQAMTYPDPAAPLRDRRSTAAAPGRFPAAAVDFSPTDPMPRYKPLKFDLGEPLASFRRKRGGSPSPRSVPCHRTPGISIHAVQRAASVQQAAHPLTEPWLRHAGKWQPAFSPSPPLPLGWRVISGFFGGCQPRCSGLVLCLVSPLARCPGNVWNCEGEDERGWMLASTL